MKITGPTHFQNVILIPTKMSGLRTSKMLFWYLRRCQGYAPQIFYTVCYEDSRAIAPWKCYMIPMAIPKCNYTLNFFSDTKGRSPDTKSCSEDFRANAPLKNLYTVCYEDVTANAPQKCYSGTYEDFRANEHPKCYFDTYEDFRANAPPIFYI